MAAYDARKAECVLDPDVLLSMYKRSSAVEAEDLSATPEADRMDRCWTGDMPYIAQLPGGNFTVLMMTDHQVRFWLHCCARGLNGLYLDATEGMVRVRDAWDGVPAAYHGRLDVILLTYMVLIFRSSRTMVTRCSTSCCCTSMRRVAHSSWPRSSRQ